MTANKQNKREPQAGDIIVFQQGGGTLWDATDVYSVRGGVVAFIMKSTEAETTFMIAGKFFKTNGYGWREYCVITNTHEEMLIQGGDDFRRLIRMKSRSLGLSNDMWMNPQMKVSL